MKKIGLLLMLAGSATAEVISKAENGFEVRHTFAVHLEPASSWKQLLRVASWWHPDHTWSGKAQNLSLKAEAGGCFCEQLPGNGSVQHMQVLYADKNRLLRLRGALGPLQEIALDGVMTWELLAGKDGTQVTMTYRVMGYVPGGAQKLADPVDQVLQVQMERLHNAMAKRATH